MDHHTRVAILIGLGLFSIIFPIAALLIFFRLISPRIDRVTKGRSDSQAHLMMPMIFCFYMLMFGCFYAGWVALVEHVVVWTR